MILGTILNRSFLNNHCYVDTFLEKLVKIGLLSLTIGHGEIILEALRSKV